MDFRLPPLGEGIDSATVVAVKVNVGDSVSAGQDLLDVETDKATVPVTAEAAGSVTAVLVKPGQKIGIGTPLLSFSGGDQAPAKAAQKPAAEPKLAAPTPKAEEAAPPQAQTPSKIEFKLPPLGEGIDSATVVAVKIKPGDTVAVGTEILEVETDKASMNVPSDVAGTVESVNVKQGQKIGAGAVIAVLMGTAPVAATPKGKPVAIVQPITTKSEPAKAEPVAVAPSNGKADHTPAGPATRRLARELGVSLAELRGSGRGGRVTLDDVKGFVREERTKVKQGGVAVGGSIVNAFTLPALPDFAKFGEVERKPVAKIRETIAKNLTVAWRTMPMVTQNDLADITDLEAWRKKIVETSPKGSPKITWTVLAVKACVAALKEFPNFNSSYDMNAGELIQKKYYHIGIAVDTEKGLMVPVLRDADKKSLKEIAAEMQSLAEKARGGKLTIDEMRGGTFTITNLGGIGGTYFTPIVNYPEVAILGMSRSALQPAVHDGQIVPRLMLPLSLTYDHRVVDGADGARFTTRLVQLFSDPMRLLMES